MPIIATSRHERLTAEFPVLPSPQALFIAQTWRDLRAKVEGELPEPLAIFDGVLQGLLQHDSTQEPDRIFFHRLTGPEREQLAAETTQRGAVNNMAYLRRAAQMAIDGWNQAYTADLQPIPVPPTGPNQRAEIEAIVADFHVDYLIEVGRLALESITSDLKKSWSLQYQPNSPLLTGIPASNLPAGIAESGTMALMASNHPATALEGSTSAPTGN